MLSAISDDANACSGLPANTRILHRTAWLCALLGLSDSDLSMRRSASASCPENFKASALREYARALNGSSEIARSALDCAASQARWGHSPAKFQIVQICKAQFRKSAGIPRVQFNCALKEASGITVALQTDLSQDVASAQYKIVCGEAVCRGQRNPRLFCLRDPDRQSRHNLAGQPVLDFKQVKDVFIISVRPYQNACCGLTQLHIQADFAVRS